MRERFWSKSAFALYAVGLASSAVSSPSAAHAQQADKEDFNADGRADLVWYDMPSAVATFWLTDRSHVLRLNGVSVRTYPTVTLEANFGKYRKLCGSGDFDGDGIPDLLWEQGHQNIGLEFLSADLASRSIRTISKPSDLRDLTMRAIVDLDGDGVSELIASHNVAHRYAPELYIYQMTAILNLKQTRNRQIAFADLDGGVDMTPVAAADFDRDGKSELVMWNSWTKEFVIAVIGQGNPTSMYNEPTFKVTSSHKLPRDLPEANGEWTAAGAGDLDGDQNPDLVFHHRASGEISVWFIRDGSVTSRVVLGSQPPGFGTPKVIDLNHDGRSDLVWHNQQVAHGPGAGANQVWYMNGASVTQVESLAPTAVESYLGRM